MPKFKTGKSGNPAGRPKGGSNRTTDLARTMLTNATPEILKTLIDQAKAGEPVALRIVANRLLPSKRSMEPIALPDTSTPEGCARAITILIAEAAQGNIAPDEARNLVAMIEASSSFYQGPLKLSGLYNAILEEVGNADPAIQQRVVTRLQNLVDQPPLLAS